MFVPYARALSPLHNVLTIAVAVAMARFTTTEV